MLIMNCLKINYMKRMSKALLLGAALVLIPVLSRAQYRDGAVVPADSTVVLTLDDALKIALSENVSVKVADMEIERTEYARKGTYASLLPQVNGTGSYQRTIKKQVMYMGGSDDDGGGGGMGGMMSGILDPIMYYINQIMLAGGYQIPPYVAPVTPETESSDNGFAVGRLNTYSAGISLAMPLVNAQLWESLKLTGDQVELSVEQARESRLGTVASVKQAFYAALMAKEAFNVYKEVYENAVENFRQTEMRFNAQKASELDLTRAKANVASAIPNVYNAENSVMLALWQLKAVMGVDLDMSMDIAGKLEDYADHMFYDIHSQDDPSLDRNTTLRQLAIQAEMLAKTIRTQQYAYLPTLSLAGAYSYNAMTDDFKFSNYHWTPYSYVGFQLSIPIFSGGKRYHDVKQSKVQAAELDLQRINAERQLKIGIRQSLSTMETAMRTYDASKEGLATAEKAYDIAEKSYQLGGSTLTDLNNTQLVLTQSRLAVSQAIYNFLVAKAGLEQTLGYDFNEEK